MNISEEKKAFIASALHTFATAFVVTAGSTLSSGVQWDKAFWLSLVAVALRAGVKAVLSTTSFPLLGGKR